MPRQICAVVILLAVVAACGATARERMARSSFVGVTAARDGFVAWDGERQAQIVAEATSLVDGREALAAYRADREQVVAKFVAAYAAVALIATNPDAPLGEMVAAGEALYEAIGALQARPGTPPAAATDTAPAPAAPPAQP